MAQLLVRNIETSLVKRLRSHATAQSVSVEEAHRRLLRRVLARETARPAGNFVDYLRAIPCDSDVRFARRTNRPRDVDL
jgi:plasmid stability protein